MNSSQSKTVLYIEDNPVNAYLMQAIFDSRPNVRLQVLTHGQAGLDFAAQHRPDLILLDMNLPDMDGEEFLRHLRADEGSAKIPVVVVSADAMGEHRGLCQSLGIADYITKPFDLDQFEKIVNRYLNE